MKRVQRVRQTYKRPRRHFVASLIRKMEYFVNMENGRDLPRPSRRFAIVAGLLIGSWLVLALPIPGMAFVVVGLIIASVVLAIGWRKKFPLIVLLLNPAFFSLSSGICEWLHERPRLWYTGLPGDEFFNLIDPVFVFLPQRPAAIDEFIGQRSLMEQSPQVDDRQDLAANREYTKHVVRNVGYLIGRLHP